MARALGLGAEIVLVVAVGGEDVRHALDDLDAVALELGDLLADCWSSAAPA